MEKFILQWAVWQQSRDSWCVIGSCVKTRHTEYLICTREGLVRRLDTTTGMPQLKLWYPQKWQALPPRVRSGIRGFMLSILERKYGAELPSDEARRRYM
jgi:hypothetical protein